MSVPPAPAGNCLVSESLPLPLPFPWRGIQAAPTAGASLSPPLTYPRVLSITTHQLSTLLDLLHHIKMLSPALTEKNKQNTVLTPLPLTAFCLYSLLIPPHAPPSLLSPLQTGFCLLGFCMWFWEITLIKISARFCLLVLSHLSPVLPFLCWVWRGGGRWGGCWVGVGVGARVSAYSPSWPPFLSTPDPAS